jgi:hypothetical protein
MSTPQKLPGEVTPEFFQQSQIAWLKANETGLKLRATRLGRIDTPYYVNNR